MAAPGWINLVTPQGGVMTGGGENAHFPFQVVTPQGVVWLTQVPIDQHLPILLRSGYAVAPDELQSAQPPRAPTRSLTNLMV